MKKYLLLVLLGFGSFSVVAEDTGKTWDEVFEENKDKFTTLKCSGKSKTTMSYAGIMGLEPNTEIGTFSLYYYFNEDYLFRRLGRLDALAYSSLIHGWKPIPFHSDVWISDDSISFNSDYPKDYLDENPLPGMNTAIMEQIAEKHTTLIDRNTGEYKYTYTNSMRAIESQTIINREDVWTGDCEVVKGEKKF